MSALVPVFEVRVRTESDIRMFHIEARTHRQALKRGNKYGHPISARKVDYTKIFGNIENLDLSPTNPYESAIAMDEMIWRKRNIRIDNQYRDKTQVE